MNNCSICFETKNIYILDCFHIICKDCSEKLIINENINICPICRNETKLINKKKKVKLDTYINYIIQNKYKKYDSFYKKKTFTIYYCIFGISFGFGIIHGITKLMNISTFRF